MRPPQRVITQHAPASDCGDEEAKASREAEHPQERSFRIRLDTAQLEQRRARDSSAKPPDDALAWAAKSCPIWVAVAVTPPIVRPIGPLRRAELDASDRSSA